MTAESVAFVRGFCESIGQAEAESLLRLLSQSLRKPVEQAQTDLRRALMETEPVQQQHAERDAAVL